MQVRKGTPPPTIDRDLDIDLTREEVLAILVNYVKGKLGPNLKFNDIQVVGDENDKLQNVTLRGVEVVPLNWKDTKADPAAVSTPAAPKQ